MGISLGLVPITTHPYNNLPFTFFYGRLDMKWSTVRSMMDALHICPSHKFSNVVDQMSQTFNNKRNFLNIKVILARTTFIMVVINSIILGPTF
jgi:hypothetical protein